MPSLRDSILSRIENPESQYSTDAKPVYGDSPYDSAPSLRDSIMSRIAPEKSKKVDVEDPAISSHKSAISEKIGSISGMLDKIEVEAAFKNLPERMQTSVNRASYGLTEKESVVSEKIESINKMLDFFEVAPPGTSKGLKMPEPVPHGYEKEAAASYLKGLPKKRYEELKSVYRFLNNPVGSTMGYIDSIKEDMLVDTKDKIYNRSYKHPATGEPYYYAGDPTNAEFRDPAAMPFGGRNLRPDGTPKGQGFLGILTRPDGGVSTELSIGVNINGKETLIPLLVKGLSDEQINYLLTTNDPPDKIRQDIVDIAVQHAQERIQKGLSPFFNTNAIEPSSVESPLPRKKSVIPHFKRMGKQYWETKGKQIVEDAIPALNAFTLGLEGLLGGTLMLKDIMEMPATRTTKHVRDKAKSLYNLMRLKPKMEDRMFFDRFFREFGITDKMLDDVLSLAINDKSGKPGFFEEADFLTKISLFLDMYGLGQLNRVATLGRLRYKPNLEYTRKAKWVYDSTKKIKEPNIKEVEDLLKSPRKLLDVPKTKPVVTPSQQGAGVTERPIITPPPQGTPPQGIKAGTPITPAYQVKPLADAIREKMGIKQKPPVVPKAETPKAEAMKDMPKNVYAERGGFAETDMAQETKGIEMPEILELSKDLMGRYPVIKKHLLKKYQALGMAHLRGEKGTISLYNEMFKDPVTAAKVLAHEIGHINDWLPKKYRKGNILGKIGSINNYVKGFLEEYPGAPGELTAKDKAGIWKLAQEMAKKGNVAVPKVTPEDVLAIWRDVNSFIKNRPLNDYIAGLSREQKSEIMKAAIKGKFPDWADFASAYKTAGPDAKELYRKLLRDEIIKRRLIEKESILKELKDLTMKWKPFKEGMNPKYTKYRYSDNELYADAVSVLLNNPDMLKKVAPNFYKAFFNYIERKPDFKKSYFKIMDRVKKGKEEIFLNRQKARRSMFGKGSPIRAKAMKRDKKSIFDILKEELVDKNAPRIKYVKMAQKKGIYIPPEDNPMYWAEEYPYVSSSFFQYLRDTENNVRIPLRKAGMSDVDLDEYMFLKNAAGKWSEKATPLGTTKITAADDLASYKKQIGEANFNLLEKLAKEFGRIRHEHAIPIIKKANSYDPKLMAEITGNKEYVKRDVLYYLDKKYGKNTTKYLHPSVGTFQEIDSPLTATIIQDAILMRASVMKIERQKFIDLMNEAFPKEIRPAELKFNGKYKVPVEPSDPKMGLVTVMDGGKIKGYYLPKDVAENFNKEALLAGAIVNAIGKVSSPFKRIFTTNNPIWAIFNLRRDIKAMAKNLPDTNLIEAYWYVAKSMREAVGDVYKGISSPDVAEMYKKRMLIVGRYYPAFEESEKAHLDKLVQSYVVSPEKHHKGFVKPFIKLLDHLEKIGQITERSVKIAGSKKLKAVPARYYPSARRYAKYNKPPEGYGRQSMGIDTDMEAAHMVRTLVGSPDFKRKGYLSPLYNSIFLFSNAGKEGSRASIEAARLDPISYTWKTMKYDIIPKILMYGAAIGLIGGAASKALKTMYDYIPERDKTHYITVPLGYTKKGKVVYMVIVQDFTGQLVSGLLWKFMNTRKTDDIKEIADLISGGLPYTGLNPILSTFYDTQLFLRGKPVYDSWAGREVIPESVFTANDERMYKEYAKHLWNELGGSVAYRFKNERVSQIKGELEKMYDLPLIGNFLSRFIRVSDRGIEEKAFKKGKEVRQQSYRDLLDAKDVLYKIIDGKELSKDDLIALGKKPHVLENKAILKLIAEKYGMQGLEIYLSGNSKEESQAMLEEWIKLKRKK